MPLGVALHAFGHPGKLLWRRFGLVAVLPGGGGQAVDHFARRCLVKAGTGIVDPIGQAIAAEPRQPHQIDVLRIMPMPQVPDETAECRGCHGIGHSIKRIRVGIGRCQFCIRIHMLRPWVLQVGRP